MKAVIVLIVCLALIPLGSAGVTGQQLEGRAAQVPAAPHLLEDANSSFLEAGAPNTEGHWEQLPLNGGWIYSLAIDPFNSQILYAGAYGGGVVKSTNGGAAWTASSSGLADSYVACLAIDPSNSQTLYAGTDGDGVYKSSNGGTSWVSSSGGLTNSTVMCLAVDPSNPQTLYAGTWGGGVCKSGNGGTSWVQGFLSGYPDGRFRPNNLITKAEILTVLMRLLPSSPLSMQSPNFQDCQEKESFYPSVEKALESGILEIPDPHILIVRNDAYFLEPNTPASRAQTAVLLVRALRMNNEGTGN